METPQTKRVSSYAAGPPWVFKGRALYQLHLVKAEIARKIIPKELKLVQAFGYTLGGIFLAHYDDSPAGMFDELVVIAGTVWNPPTSCAWAARVLVNSKDACNHGRKEIGLPSHLALFSQSAQIVDDQQHIKKNLFSKLLPKWAWQNNKCPKLREKLEMEISEEKDSLRKPFCHINTMGDVIEPKPQRTWRTPSIRMSLPSFSGCTEHQPQLLNYSCDVECRIRIVQPSKVLASDYQYCSHVYQSSSDATSNYKQITASRDTTENDAQSLVVSVLISKPILSLVFEHMKVHVKAPTLVKKKEQVKRERTYGTS
uniref:Protein NEOXANTHIN-DEFICIENT 1 n=1 Tax=Picea sitchensis TaxID=3332 RepID=B8LLS7_PICSI|nr:unknown [Picea sitchensis]